MENKTTGHPKLLRVNTLTEGSNIDSIAINASFRAIDVVEYFRYTGDLVKSNVSLEKSEDAY